MLNGDTLSSDAVLSERAARAPPSWGSKLAGFAGIFGFSALLAGGGSEALFILRSEELWSIEPAGDKCPG